MNDETMENYIETIMAEVIDAYEDEDVEVIDTEIKIVDHWASSILVDDNDIVYLRKKNGITYVMKVEPHVANKWEQLDPTAKPVYVDQHGLKLAPELAPEGVEVPVEKELKPIPNLTLGWYQDDKANLYKYLGGGVWDSEINLFGKLLVKAEAGELEYLG
jgi:hypothetical protein